MNEILEKILPYEARAEFCQIFCSFFGQWNFKKTCFWDLLTFSMLKFSVKFWPSEKKYPWHDTLKVFKNGQPVYRQGHVCSLYRCHDLALLLPACALHNQTRNAFRLSYTQRHIWSTNICLEAQYIYLDSTVVIR